MKNLHIILIALLLFVTALALYQKASQRKAVEQLHALESSYYSNVKNNSYLEDKVKSFQEKSDEMALKNNELVEITRAKDEYISTLESKLQEAAQEIEQLGKKVSQLEDLIVGIQSGIELP
ncbi:MAG: hypothetical protein PHQ54_00475 [Candidatus Omnitrophica bacterium]|nr:hypothetical protein [Candidatus Omnitrophota bacterium]